MKVLFWVPPWAAHGDPFFFLNTVKKHLIPQANTLAGEGCSIDFVLPEIMLPEKSRINDSINIIDITYSDQVEIFSGFSDPSVNFYRSEDINGIIEVSNKIRYKLSSSYDVIFLWETPVPFLENAFPDALIIHQMPGAFSRAPYPHLVTFDPVGLYKRGSLFKYADQIITDKKFLSESIGREFSNEVRKSIEAIQPFDRVQLSGKRFKKLKLVPLQVSAHYSFIADTKYSNQTDFLFDVLNSTPEDEGVVVTQYVTPNVSDTVLSDNLLNSLKKRWKNIIFDKSFNNIPSVSQYLLPLVDTIETCSSSLGLQGLVWGKNLSVNQDTFIKPYDNTIRSYGYEDRQKYDLSTLNFILTRNQPLASFVVQDGKFLVNLLQEMISRKKSGHEGCEITPDFSSINSDYYQALMDSFTVGRAARTLEKLPNAWTVKNTDISKYRRAVSSQEIKVITFDLFDTLIKRPTETPADVYKFLEKEAIKITGGVAEDFARVRLNAEVETRNSSTKGEISLNEIYDYIKSYYDFDDSTIDKLISLETESEINFVTRRDFGKSLWDIAVSSRKPIYIISDMYLDESVIIRMLSKLGYNDYSGVFVSSTYGVRKKEGGLFDSVIQSLGISPASILHTGDNKIADIDMAKERGISTFRLLRSIDRMRTNELYKKIYNPKSGAGEKARSVIAGLTAHSLFDHTSGENERNSLFQGSSLNLGYAALGPMISGFMLWLGREAKRGGVTKLFFLSREGWLLKQVYDELHKHVNDAIPSFYLYASRRATRVANLKSKGDVLSLAGNPYRAGVSIGDLIKSRFGLETSDIPEEFWAASSYSGPEQVLDSDQVSKVRFSKFCSSISNLIIQHADVERESYLAYLQETGFISEEKPAIVDIGWKANMQAAISNLLQKPIQGYYYATLQGAEINLVNGSQINSYAGDFLALNHPSSVLANRHIVEYLTCHIEASLIKMKRNAEGNLEAIFLSEEDQGHRASFIEKVHRGAVDFSKDLSENFKNYFDQIYIDSALAERVFSSYVNTPHLIDAELLVGHYFEDRVGGVSRQYLIKPEPRDAVANSVWKIGAETVHLSPQKVANGVNKDKKPSAVEKELKKGDDSVNIVDDPFNGSETLRIKLEKFAVKRLASPRKIAKYERDRDAFFQDSRNPLMKKWYQII